MDLTLKGNKKSKPIVFERGGQQREEAKIRSGKVTVGDGLSADSGNYLVDLHWDNLLIIYFTVPNLKAPEALPVHQLQKEIIPRNPNGMYHKPKQ